jgi:hypothetical protein
MTNRLLVVIGVWFVLLPAYAMAPMDVPAPPSAINFTAVVSGAWSSATTWSGGQVPSNGAVVDIPENITVTLSGNSYRIQWLQVRGTFALSSLVDSHLFVDTLVVHDTGAFTLSPFLPQTKTATVTFTSSGTTFDTTWDPKTITRGLISSGTVTIIGVSKSHMKKVTADVAKGTSTVTLDAEPSHWRVGDRVVLAGTYFRRNQSLQDEQFSIASISGTTVTIDGTFQFDHLRVTSGTTTPPLHLVNLTRNVTFESETTTHWYDRGHVMLMNADSRLENVAFVNLGRTDKSKPLDDFYSDGTKLVKEAAANVENRRGRYAVHIHQTGHGATIPADPPTVVDGCVVNGTTGWGFVNHSSHVDFRHDVAYNFTGAGFVTEAGDELGNFFDDIAIHGIGQISADGDGRYYKARMNFGNSLRPQAIADVAFSGQGFWFSGPALQVRGIVANSCNGDGVIWHTTGTVDVNQSDAVTGGTGALFGRYTYFPEGWISQVYGTMIPSNFAPRHWTGGTGRMVIADLPILQCINVDSYANLIGFRLRFNNFDSVVWYNEDDDMFGYMTQMQAAAGSNGNMHTVPGRVQEGIGTTGTINLWNNEEAFSARYVSHATVNSVNAINRLDFDEDYPSRSPGIRFTDGVEDNVAVDTMTWTNLVVDGYELAHWLGTGETGVPDNMTVTTPVYRNYASAEFQSTGCSVMANLSATPSSGGNASISWSAASGSTRYLIRYKATDQQQWRYVEITNANTTSTAVSGLTAGKTYKVQITRGCATGVSDWTAAASILAQ